MVLVRGRWSTPAGRVLTAYGWSGGRATVGAVRADLAGPLESLRTARLERGTVYWVAYNDSAATSYAADTTRVFDRLEDSDAEFDREAVRSRLENAERRRKLEAGRDKDTDRR